MLAALTQRFFKKYKKISLTPENFHQQCEDLLAQLFAQNAIQPIPVAFAIDKDTFITFTAGALRDNAHEFLHKRYQCFISKEFEARVNALRGESHWPAEWIKSAYMPNGINKRYAMHILTGKEFPHLTPTPLSAHSVMAALKEKSKESAS